MEHTPMTQQPPAPAGDLVAYRPCGCIGFASAKDYLGVDGALELARCVLAGWKPGYLTIEQVRAARWSCDACRDRTVARALPLLADAGQQPTDPRWRVCGTITMSITFAIDGLVIAPTADQALDALAESPTPLFFHGDDEQLHHEWESDDLTTTQVEPGAAPSQGEGLPEWLAQLTLI